MFLDYFKINRYLVIKWGRNKGTISIKIYYFKAWSQFKIFNITYVLFSTPSWSIKSSLSKDS